MKVDKDDSLYRDSSKKYDIVKYISERYNIKYKLVKSVERFIAKYILYEIINNRNVNIDGFGEFKIINKKTKNNTIKTLDFEFSKNIEKFFNNEIDFALSNKFESVDDILPEELLEKIKELNKEYECEEED